MLTKTYNIHLVDDQNPRKLIHVVIVDQTVHNNTAEMLL